MIAGWRNFPDVAAVNVVLIRRKNDLLAVRAGGDEFHFKIPGREKFCSAAVRGEGIQMNPAAALPRKNDAVAGGPDQLILRDYFVENAAATSVRAPDFLALAGCGIGDSNRPRLSFTLRTKRKFALRNGDANKRDSAAVR